MSQWNRKDYPTATDADEWGNVLVLTDEGYKITYNWREFIAEKMAREQMGRGDWAWSPLPKSDKPLPIVITITVGNKVFEIAKDENTLKVQYLHDPNATPMEIEDTLGGIAGFVATVNEVLSDEILHAPPMTYAEYE